MKLKKFLFFALALTVLWFVVISETFKNYNYNNITWNSFQIGDTVDINTSSIEGKPTVVNVTSIVGSVEKMVHDPLACLKYINDKEIVPTIEDISNVSIRQGKSIFFHETSCRSRNANRIVLNDRQACAVESAALLNPSFDVYLLILSPATITHEQDQIDRILQALSNYSNIHIKHLSYEKYFLNTPVEELYRSGKIETSQWAMIHVSDVIRYVTLWKYGGIYLDLDVVVIKSLEDLEPNFSGLQDTNDVAAGVMSFDHQGKGHEWAEKCLEDLNSDFRPDLWSYNALGVIQRLLNKICKTKNPNEMNRENCQGYEVFPPPVFYPIPYPQWHKYFQNKYLGEVMEKVSRSKTVHMWNKLSEKTQISLGDNSSAYGLLAKQFCPKIYEVCGKKY